MTITVAAEPEVTGDLFQPRVRLTVTSSPASGEPLTVWRIHEDGSEWRVITPTGTRLAAGATVLFDYHAPLNQLVTYRGETATQTGPAGAPTVVVSSTPWVLPADEPELAVPAAFVDDLGDEEASYDGAAASTLAGTARKAGTSDRTVGLSSSVVLGFEPALLLRWRILQERGDALLVNLPDERWDRPWFWILPSRFTIQNRGRKEDRFGGRAGFGGKAGHPFRYAQIQYDPIDPPDTDLTPLWTDGDCELAFATDAAMEAAYASDLAHELDDRTA